MSWWFVYSVAATVWITFNSILLVLQRRSAASTIAWLFVLVFVPVVGLLIYRIIGPLHLERRKRKRSGAKRIVDEGMRGLAALDCTAIEQRQLASLPIQLGGMPPLRAESMDLYFDGASAYEAILAAVAAAQDHIHLEYYIWEPDTIGTRFRDALIERARAGVTVRLLLDGAGSGRLSRAFLRPLREAGVVVAWFNPVRLRTIRRHRVDFRTHRKIVVCDGRIGFTGGMNISNVHTDELSSSYWRDTHLRLTGVAVWPLQRIFFEDWYFATEELVEVTNATVPPPREDGAHLVQIVASGPDESSFALHKVFFAAIGQATERVWLTTPYFVPDESLLTSLVTAALRGVDVRVIVPKRGDSRLLDLAARSYFPDLLEGRVRVLEYEPRFVHAKTIVCDRDLAIVSTANFDNRSFRLNFEVGVLLFGAQANAQLADMFERDSKSSRELVVSDLARVPFTRRLGEASARLLSPLL
jgi:cardiolipin synthase A/B